MSELRARVISQEKGLYQISSGTEVKQASVSGKFRYEAQTVSDYPAVGDYVLAEWQEAGSPAIIRSLFPRKSCFLRKAAGSAKQEQVVAANIDTVFLCMSRNQNFNLRRLERYLSIAYDSGAEPVVVLTKADLCQDPEDKLAQVRTAAPGAEILSWKTGRRASAPEGPETPCRCRRRCPTCRARACPVCRSEMRRSEG